MMRTFRGRVLAILLVLCILTALAPVATANSAVPNFHNDAVQQKKQTSAKKLVEKHDSAQGYTQRLMAQSADERLMSVGLSGDYYYYDWGSEVEILLYIGKGGAVTIPSTLGGKPVTEIGEGAFEGTAITSVTIPNSVKYIWNLAFAGCAKLTKVTIPKSVVYIGWWTFYETPWWNSQKSEFVVVGNGVLIKYNGKGGNVTIPKTVIVIGPDVFAENKKITGVTIPLNVKEIASGAFYWCDGLKSISMANGVEEIGMGAFSKCTSLTNFTLSSNLTYIEMRAFEDCHSLTRITIPSKVTYIGAEAFINCGSLASITIPSGVTYVGLDAFARTPWLIAQKQEFVIAGSVLIKYNGNGGYVNIPNTVVTIGEKVFWGRQDITGVTIPNSVMEIGNDAFYWCDGISSIVIPSSVYYIGDRAFYTCNGLTSLIIPENVFFLGEAAFGSCLNLEHVTIQGGDVLIFQAAFGNCSKLKNVLFEKEPPFLLIWDAVYGPFYATHWDMTIYYTAAYASYWAPRGEKTWEGYPIVLYVPVTPSPSPTPKPTPVPTPFPTSRTDGSVDYGDVRCTGNVSAADAAAILRYLVELVDLGGLCLDNADANGDGVVNAADAALILRWLVDLAPKLGPK